ncbi:unnamed protein product [Toxocara canis]|uniref:DUF5641 domain-containing protein n=1 Tax=Toxocara canis TaxID=6265 RepID=A0A183UNL4_TOXCA|nr:unnamed protein product [Toxocara canis]
MSTRARLGLGPAKAALLKNLKDAANIIKIEPKGDSEEELKDFYDTQKGKLEEKLKRIIQGLSVLEQINEDWLREIEGLTGNKKEAAEAKSTSPAKPPVNSIRLPKITLPEFHGDPKQWSSFWSAFEAAVDSQHIPNVQKLAYLQWCLKGVAKEAVAGFRVQDENYDELLIEEKLPRWALSEVYDKKETEDSWNLEMLRMTIDNILKKGEAINKICEDRSEYGFRAERPFARRPHTKDWSKNFSEKGPWRSGGKSKEAGASSPAEENWRKSKTSTYNSQRVTIAVVLQNGSLHPMEVNTIETQTAEIPSIDIKDSHALLEAKQFDLGKGCWKKPRLSRAIVATGIQHDVKRLWRLEELGISSPNKEGEEDENALKQFYKTIERKETGRYSVRWPWKKDEPELPYLWRKNVKWDDKFGSDETESIRRILAGWEQKKQMIPRKELEECEMDAHIWTDSHCAIHWILDENRQLVRFINNVSKKKGKVTIRELSCDELEDAERFLIRQAQSEDENTQKEKRWRLVIDENHIKSGASTTLTKLRRKYWIPKGRRTVNKQIKRCQECKGWMIPPFQVPHMPQLPEGRTSRATQSFESTGMDYMGPTKKDESSGTIGKEVGRNLQESRLLLKILAGKILDTLRERSQVKHRNPRSTTRRTPREDEIVLVKEEDAPRGKWRLGRIVNLCKRRDNSVRTTEVQMSNGRTIKLPISLLVPLEVRREDERLKENDQKVTVDAPSISAHIATTKSLGI